jgi:hypothetical protein
LAFILPPLFTLSLWPKRSLALRILDWSIVIAGAGALVYGTEDSIRAIVDAFRSNSIAPNPQPRGNFFVCMDS